MANRSWKLRFPIDGCSICSLKAVAIVSSRILETSLVGTFEFVVRKDLHLKAPRGETPAHFIAMGLNPDLTEALKMAVREAIDFLVTEKHLSREDAYMLCSTAVDFNVTQAVDGTKGVHAMIPKSIFK